MWNILFISSGIDDKGLSELIGTTGDAVVRLTSANQARQRLHEGDDFDLIVINAPLQDEFGDELALTAVENTMAGVMLAVNAAQEDEIESHVGEYGVVVIGKPVHYQTFYQAYKLLTAMYKRMQYLKNENDKLKRKMEELKLISRAKCVLIQEMHMNENEAHRYIEKEAMDFRKSKKDVAEKILRLFG